MAGSRQTLRHPLSRLTVRARMALLYGLVSALVGIAPVVLTCFLIEHDLGNTVGAAVARTGVAVDVHGEPTPTTPEPTVWGSTGYVPTTATPRTGATPSSARPLPPTGSSQPENPAVAARQGLLVILVDSCPAGRPGSSSPATTTDTECFAQVGAVVPARAASAAQLGGSISSQLVQQMVLYSAIALAALVLLALVLGWWLAGRALRPVHQMAAAARRLSSVNLHERIPLNRPKDELRELGETFNALLDRLGSAFASQQRFVANAAHELRTPLAIQRATIQIGLEELPTDPAELAAVRDELLATNRRHEQLIDGLLLLARSEGGLENRKRADLARITEDAVGPLLAEARQQSVELTVRAEPAAVDGDVLLLGQLVTNLVQNAIRYNRPGGRVDIRTGEHGLTVINTGPEIPPEAVAGLFEPFRRLHRDRTGSASGSGLGLSIVTSIASAHGGEITAEPNATGGGLTIGLRLPPPIRPSIETAGTHNALPPNEFP